MKKNLFGVLVSKTEGMKPIAIKDDLDEFYKILDCDCIDVTSRKIGNKYFDIICDDEGLCKADPIVTAADRHYKPALVGNLFIVNGNDETGEFESLTEPDMLMVMQSKVGVIDFNSPTMFRDVLVIEE